MKALVLAGGFPQISLIKSLKQRGITTLLADYYERPPAKEYADVFYQVSTLDIDAIRNIVVKENADLIITVCTDQALLTMAKVSEDLGLPCYMDYKTALNVTNKQYMKKIFAENGIPTAKYIVAHDVSEIQEGLQKFPLVVKPADCNSSKGVVKVNNFSELEKAFDFAKKLSRTETVIIEEYISGTEISVDAWVENGQAKILCMSENEKIPGTFVIFRGKYPSREAMCLKDKIQSIVQKIADSFGLKNCPMLIQMIADGENIFVLEFSARTGGGTKHIMIQHVAGLDVIDFTVELALGKIPHIPNFKMSDIFLADEFIYCSEGKFDYLSGFDEIKSKGILTNYYLFKLQGAEFDGNVRNSGDRIAGFTIKSNSISELRKKHSEAAKNLKIIDRKGHDIMRHDLLINL